MRQICAGLAGWEKMLTSNVVPLRSLVGVPLPNVQLGAGPPAQGAGPHVFAESERSTFGCGVPFAAVPFERRMTTLFVGPLLSAVSVPITANASRVHVAVTVMLPVPTVPVALPPSVQV